MIEINEPYNIKIYSREQAADYIKNQCNNCPKYSGSFDCSGAQMYNCMKAIDKIIEHFGAIKITIREEDMVDNAK